VLPSTQHPYVYVGNNPVNLVDPSGEFIVPLLLAVGVGAAIGGVGGGVGYALAHPGGRPEDYLHDAGFRRAVGVGALSGAVAGGVGFGVGGLVAGLPGLGGAVLGGALTGAAASGAGQAMANVLTPCVKWNAGLDRAMFWGGVTGGIAGSVGWKIGQWRAGRAAVHWPSRPHGAPDHWNTIQQEVQRMAKSGKYSSIFVRKTISTGTGGQVQSRVMPDILARTTTGKYVIVEVVSPSQTYAELQAKMNKIIQMFVGLSVEGRIIQP